MYAKRIAALFRLGASNNRATPQLAAAAASPINDGNHSGDWNRVKQALDRLPQKQSAHKDDSYRVEEVRRAQQHSRNAAREHECQKKKQER